MPQIFANPTPLSERQSRLIAEMPMPSVDVDAPSALLAECPAHTATPLMSSDALASRAGIAQVFVKDERNRMGLGSFKALGAAYAIAREARQAVPEGACDTALADRGYVTASAGNHGMSVAAGARLFGARAVIYLAETTPSVFIDRLREKGADVRIEGADYAASMAAAQKCAVDEGLTLLSDSSWEGYADLPYRVMEGYLALARETVDQMPQPPTHIFLQAGVGGLAAACAAYFRKAWGDTPKIIVVEPAAAPALLESVLQGRCVLTEGPVSNMGRLDCKEPSLIALNGLAADADFFLTVSDEDAQRVVDALAAIDLASSPSGAAGIAGLLTHAGASELGLDEASIALCVMSEGPAD